MEYSTLKNSSLGQTTLEICLVIAVAVLLLLGVISVWNYFNKVKVERLDNYRSMRLAALDLRTGITGKQVDYEPPPLDIFSMAANIDDAPGAQGVGGYPPENPCSIEYNELMQLPGELLADVGELSEDFANLMVDSMNQRIELGMLKVWYKIWGITVVGLPFPLWFELYDYMMTWLYEETDNFFLNGWDTIGADFDNKIDNSLGQFEVAFFDGLLMGSIPFGWLFGFVVEIRFKDEEAGSFYTPNGVRNNFIAPGIAIANQMSAVGQEKIIKMFLPELISKVAEAKFNACIREAEGEDTTCDEQCGSYLEQAEIEIYESIDEANNGQLSESSASYQEVINQLDQYETCFIGCSGGSPWYVDPCMVDCEDEYDAYIDKTLEALTAAAEGRLGDLDDLLNEAQDLLDEYQDCVEDCS